MLIVNYIVYDCGCASVHSATMVDNSDWNSNPNLYPTRLQTACTLVTDYEYIVGMSAPLQPSLALDLVLELALSVTQSYSAAAYLTHYTQ